MIHIQKRLAFLMSISLILSPASTRPNGWGAGLLVVGLGLAAIGTAIYAYGETDYMVVDNAGRDKDIVSDAYKVDVDAFRLFRQLTSSRVNIQHVINSFDEVNELFPTAQRVIAAGTTMREYMSQVLYDINLLHTHLTKLEKRKHALERKRYRTSEEARLLQRMQYLYDDIDDFLPYLRIYHEFFSAHIAYFDLYEYENELYKIYQQEFLYGNTYQYNTLALAQVLKQCVGTKYANAAYPYITYKKELDRHIDGLQSRMSGTYRYTGRYAMAQQLEQYLICVRGIIVADSSYEREKEMRQREREYREQQQLMHQQIAAQQQLAAAQQAHAAAINTATIMNAVTPRVHVVYNN